MSNKHINAKSQYLPFVEEVLLSLSERGELEIIIDGSKVGKGCMCLMFSVVYKGRAIPLVWRVVKKKKGHFKELEHVNLLLKLKALVPEKVKVTILGDGEFDGVKWQEKIQFWHGKDYDEPLFLVTNIDDGYLVQSYYIKRFLIETLFRDIKSKGFNIQKSGLRNPEKLSRLLMCCCFAFILGVLSGVKARKSKLYDLVCEQNEKSLSLFQLGLNFIKKLVDLRQWRAFSIHYDILRALE